MNIGNDIKDILLQEHTTGSTLGVNPDEVIPRYLKRTEVQRERTRAKSEVFTPVGIVKRMNDHLDASFDGSDEEYIRRTVLEVTCGEAPFITTGYDATSGAVIPQHDRVGILDRKLRRITTDDEGVWRRLAELALKSTYGYEWQEDSLYLARVNVLLAVADAFTARFGKEPADMERWAEIVSYNFFRMDGVSMCVPETEIPARVMNWESGEMERFDGKADNVALW